MNSLEILQKNTKKADESQPVSVTIVKRILPTHLAMGESEIQSMDVNSVNSVNSSNFVA